MKVLRHFLRQDCSLLYLSWVVVPLAYKQLAFEWWLGLWSPQQSLILGCKKSPHLHPVPRLDAKTLSHCWIQLLSVHWQPSLIHRWCPLIHVPLLDAKTLSHCWIQLLFVHWQPSLIDCWSIGWSNTSLAIQYLVIQYLLIIIGSVLTETKLSIEYVSNGRLACGLN